MTGDGHPQIANGMGFTSAQVQIPAPNSIAPPEDSDFLIGEGVEDYDPHPPDKYRGDLEAVDSLLRPGDMAYIRL